MTRLGARFFIVSLTIAFPAGLAGAAPAAAASTPAASVPADLAAEVRAVAEGIIAADNARDLDRVLGYYADDAVLMPPNEPPVQGKEGIRPRYESLFAQFLPAIESRIDEIRVDRDWAFVAGGNGGRLAPRDGGEPRVLNDAWVMVLRRSGAHEWKIARLIWHSATPTGAKPGDAASCR